MTVPVARRARAAVVSAALLCIAGCGGGDDGPRPNVLLISIDTLRADRLSCYGYERATTPVIDALAKRGVRFQHALAEAPWTIPSHVTMLSGLHPATHGVQQPDQTPSEEVELVAQLLAEEGYYTFAITDGGWMSEEQGFDRGFRSFHARKQGFERTLRDARDYIRHRSDKGPWFGFLHTYDVHCPYDPPEPYRSAFVSEKREELDADGKCGNPYFNALELSRSQARYLSDRYDGSIRALDAELEGFLVFLEESGAFANTVVILTSDHGEEFLEHGQIGHERSLFREVLEIPLIVVAPGVAPRIVTETAGLVDLVPTIAELTRLDLDEDDVDGRSLLALMRGESVEGWPTHRLSVLEREVSLASWLGPNTHLLMDRTNDVAVMFDLGADPMEQSDAAELDPERAGAMQIELENKLDLLERERLKATERGALSAERLEDLRKIGY